MTLAATAIVGAVVVGMIDRAGEKANVPDWSLRDVSPAESRKGQIMNSICDRRFHKARILCLYLGAYSRCPDPVCGILSVG